MFIDGIQDFNIEEVNHVSNLEPTESYFKASMIKDDIKGEGLGETKIEAIISALDDIETIKLQHLTFENEIESVSPF